jgi:protein TonB
MSAAAFSAGAFVPANRRALARRLELVAPAPRAAALAAPLSVSSSAPAQALSAAIGFPGAARKPKGANPLLVAAAVLALHAGLIYYLKHRPPEPVVQAAPAPIAVELAAPPKPLPEKKQVTPPPLSPETPHINQAPPPVAEPLPAATPQTPVVQAPPPAPVIPPPPVAEPVTPATGYAGYLNNPQPVYPQFAIDQGWEGRVLLSVHVLASGRADHVDIKHGSGHKVLDEVAARTVLQRWAFAPAKRGQTPVDGWVDVPIDFRLSN